MNSPSSPMMENSQIGRYGTLSLMKQNEVDTVITAFGIDSENLTFGKDQTCGVRLYYPDVSPIHCKITFKERKAFLVVLGAQGLVVDGCKVYANAPTSSPNTIPLTNNSTIGIHGKLFRFTYPPKELRAQLLSTPTPPNRRALRLSMIESAEVFSPRPSPNPMENLRVLQSPLKPYHMRSRSSSPLKPTFPASPTAFSSQSTAGHSEDDAEEEAIVLVEGNSPRVVEEEKDLIILEDVEIPQIVENTSPTPIAYGLPSGSQYTPAPPSMLLPPRPPITPRRSRPTLHKAVLIRSAQRAVLQAELKREEEEQDEEEEAEVFGAILEDTDDEGEGNLQDQDEDQADDHEATNADSGEQGDEAVQPRWKASLERIWPFRRSTSPTKSVPDSKDNIEAPLAEGDPMDVDTPEPANGDSEEEAKEANENPAPLYPRLDGSLAGPPPVRRLFNTPQPQRQISAQPRFSLGSSSAFSDQSRMSLGGGEPPRRIKKEDQPWKVQDLVVPPPPSSPVRPSGSVESHAKTPGTTQLTEAERRAIQERRRSAVRMPDNFFPGGIPGMGPPSPEKNAQRSPTKAGRTSLARGMGEGDQLDTRSLLEKMKETVESARAERRSSMATSPQKRVVDHTTTADDSQEFSLLRSPAKPSQKFWSAPVQDELAKPSSPRAVPPEEDSVKSSGSSAAHGDTDMADQNALDKASVESSPLKTRTAPNSVIRGKFVDTPSLADDEASPDVAGRRKELESGEDEKATKKKTKLLRGTGKPSSKSVATAASTSDQMQLIVEAPPPPKEAVSEDDETQKQPVETTQLLKPKASKARGRSPSKAPSATPAEMNGEGDSGVSRKDPSGSAVGRRTTRKASAEPDVRGATTTDEEAPAKRTRARSRSKAPEESDTDSSSRTTSSKKPTRRTTRARGKTPASEAETDDDGTHESDEITITKTKRGRRPKTAVVPEVIKEEEADETPATTKKTTTKAKKGVSASDNLPPAPAPTGMKGRSKKATLSASETPGEAEVNKENAASKDATKTTRIGRPRKAPVKVKEEALTEPETSLRSGTKTRAMRTRSKTTIK
ncbi:hypothetical protein GYMLUDRAFT_243317 [Collybiopsis luxurians FD-317 M1]|uniref:FHA domain-containing protein n=1 Tax=Collybiopsis luxurians FD-317 M1 TaxID=944289 RepID=A0A0D0CYV5_9AGAR|nr:hypothetical protein GYMLUDRAFT_243317 [Collybiopsis luxurians FD-317 M1]